MKKSIITLAACVVAGMTSYGQAKIDFITNLDLAPGKPFVFDTDGTTKVGSDIVGQLFAGTQGGSLTAIGSPVQFSSVNGNLTGGAEGLIQAGTVNVTSSGNAFTGDYQLRAWESSAGTYDNAVATGAKWGQSDVVTVQFGGPDPAGGVDLATPTAEGFTSFSLVPEPGTITLGLLGLGGLVAARRRKNA